MDFLGVKFAPFDVPLERRLQTLASGLWFYTIVFGGPLGFITAFYLVVFSNYWIGTLFYLFWAWVLDKNTCDRGGRTIEWVRNLAWWKYMKDYFPLKMKKLPDVELDPKQNYLFCAFPHGLLPTGIFNAFATNAGGFRKLFPYHTSHLITLRQHFFMPYFREFIYSLGMCSSSAESINWLLKDPDGGNVAVIAVGGTAEAIYSKPGKYEIVLNNRKGFVKLALKNGTPLVPVFSFGETDLFDQFNNPEGSLLRRFQEWFKEKFGTAPLIPLGRGFFQYSFGWVPQRKPVTIVGE